MRCKVIYLDEDRDKQVAEANAAHFERERDGGYTCYDEADPNNL